MSKKSKGSVSGVLGENVKLRNVNGKVVLSNPRPRRSNPGARDRFREAAQYARHQVSLPDSNTGRDCPNGSRPAAPHDLILAHNEDPDQLRRTTMILAFS